MGEVNLPEEEQLVTSRATNKTTKYSALVAACLCSTAAVTKGWGYVLGLPRWKGKRDMIKQDEACTSQRSAGLGDHVNLGTYRDTSSSPLYLVTRMRACLFCSSDLSFPFVAVSRPVFFQTH